MTEVSRLCLAVGAVDRVDSAHHTGSNAQAVSESDCQSVSAERTHCHSEAYPWILAERTHPAILSWQPALEPPCFVFIQELLFLFAEVAMAQDHHL
ncbi:MAG: hypothetical protein JWO19_5937 [Bryobacterales bacterium]|nr:hypothetical protein [Bryobacterales bacterium]